MEIAKQEKAAAVVDLRSELKTSQSNGGYKGHLTAARPELLRSTLTQERLYLLEIHSRAKAKAKSGGGRCIKKFLSIYNM